MERMELWFFMEGFFDGLLLVNLFFYNKFMLNLISKFLVLWELSSLYNRSLMSTYFYL